ncbi:MAG: CAP domain-containing protein, partial [Anaerovorax sp.]
KPDNTPEVKPDNTPEIKPDDTPEVKPDNKPEMDESTVNTYENKVAELVNTKRREAGLQPLAINKALSKVAEKKAEDMANQNYFSHTSPTYGSPFEMMKQFGINYKAAGENIAKGQRTPESVMTGWMNSEGHRANIMSTNYTEIGIGYVVDAKGDTYWVQMFIRP